MNYYGTWRSSYFKVHNVAEFVAWIGQLPFEAAVVEERGPEGQLTGKVALIQGSDSDSLNQFYDDPDEKERDFFQDVAEHLQENQVAIFMEVGAEGRRYVHGWAVAVRADGRTLNVSTCDIYKKVEQFWKNKEYTYCEY
jgi:hypothetical protein